MVVMGNATSYDHERIARAAVEAWRDEDRSLGPLFCLILRRGEDGRQRAGPAGARTEATCRCSRTAQGSRSAPGAHAKHRLRIGLVVSAFNESGGLAPSPAEKAGMVYVEGDDGW